MTALQDAATDEPDCRRLRERVEAEAYVASVCFKHGPPRLVGVELEWTVHPVDDPARPLRPGHLAEALGPHTPGALRPDSPHLPLPGGSPLTMEPGGQVEISALPKESLAELYATVQADTGHLAGLLGAAGLTLGDTATDPVRPPRRLLDTPRYAAMQTAFAPMGSDGLTMMCSTAGFQVCLDAGEAADLPARWAAAHVLGPPLVALFANSPRLLGADTGWASTRMRTVLRTDPSRTAASEPDDDPAGSWARRVLDTPLLCVRRPGGDWTAPRGVTFADWIGGALDPPPTTADLDYHITTLFPPVRAQGYLEIRYIDAQQGEQWLAPAALLLALMSTPGTVQSVLDVCGGVAGRWLDAARYGLADAEIRAVAQRVAGIGLGELAATGLPAELAAAVTEDIERRLHHGRGRG